MLELIGGLLLVPTIAITVWERVVSRLAPHAGAIYRLTGIVGTPVHEMAHVVACLLFGLRINKVVLYSPRMANGLLGYVNFSFSPRSARNVIGLGVQGVAPLVASGAIASWTLDAGGGLGIPSQGAVGMLVWCASLAGSAIAALRDMATSGMAGLLGAVGLLLVCMHGIPSWADIKVGLRGLLMIGLVLPLVLLAQDACLMAGGVDGEVARVVSLASAEIERWLWWGLHAAVLVVTLAVLGSIVFVLIPAGIIACVCRRR